MTRLLILGDSAGTGFGTVTAALGTAFLASGHDVRFITFSEYAKEETEPFVGRMIKLGSRDGWLHSVSPTEYHRLMALMASGTEISPEDRGVLERYAHTYEAMAGILSGTPDLDGWAPEAVVVISDPGGLIESRLPSLLTGRIPTVHYVPIEGVDIPPRWAAFWEHMIPVAMTEFGADEIARITGRRPRVAYHGVDPDAFWPVSGEHPIEIGLRGRRLLLRSKRECKEFVAHAARTLTKGRSAPDPSHLWLMRMDRHMPRKMYSSLLRSLAPVLRHHPDVEFVYHCRTSDQGGNLDDDRSKYPDIAERMNPTGFHDAPDHAGATQQALNALYNAADIYVSNSAEGFGLTIAEAMACGVPVVGLRYSSVPEVIGTGDDAGGLLVDVGGLVDNVYGYFWARPDESKFSQAVERLVLSRGARRELGRNGVERIRRLFRWQDAASVILDCVGAREEVAA